MLLKKRSKHFLIFLTLISFAASSFAQDVTKVYKGNPSPYDGWCLTERAMAKIIADKEQEDDRCQLKLGEELEKLNAKHSLKVDNLTLRIDSLEKEMESIISIKNEEIEKLEQIALDKPNDYWYLFTAGGFVVGVGVTVGIVYILGL